MQHRTPALFLLVVLAACGSNVVTPHPCSTSADCPTGAVCRDGRCQAAADGGAGRDGSLFDLGDPHAHDVVSIAIDPSSATLTSIDGSMPTQPFTATFTLHDGTTTPATGVAWSLDTRPLGTLDPADGTFVASGVVGGAGMVTAMATDSGGAMIMATASITVNLQRTVIGPGADASTPSRFAIAPMTDAARDPHVVYPLDNAVMPQNVYPADVQWTVGNAGDAFRISLTKTHVTAVGYVVHTGAGFNLDWLVDAAAWHAVAQTDPDEPAVLTVQRVDVATGDVIAGAPLHVNFAKGSISGTVYYWDIARGRIVRIDDGTAMRDEFMPTPPTALDGSSCVGCHTVSRSGRYMAGRLGGGDNIGAIFDLTTDLTGAPAPTVWPISTSPASTKWWFSSWNQDDTRIMAEENMSLELMDPMTGALVIAPGTGLPTRATHPSWAADGHAIAFLGNVTGWGGDNTTGDVQLLPVTGADTFGAPTTIHTGTSLTTLGSVDAYPTYAPDSHHIAFAHGSTSRSETGTSTLYYMSEDGSGVVQMSNAAASTVDFQPRFSPFDVAGYFWLSFLSKRDYGNSLAGNAGMGLQQIWIIAVRKDTPAGSDPSAVPYWLPGQNDRSRNIAAYWAPRACRDDGTSCAVDSECCSGICSPDTTGALVCSPPPPDRCHHEGETCSTDADCCAGTGLTCNMHVCTPPFG